MEVQTDDLETRLTIENQFLREKCDRLELENLKLRGKAAWAFAEGAKGAVAMMAVA